MCFSFPLLVLLLTGFMFGDPVMILMIIEIRFCILIFYFFVLSGGLLSFSSGAMSTPPSHILHTHYILTVNSKIINKDTGG